MSNRMPTEEEVFDALDRLERSNQQEWRKLSLDTSEADGYRAGDFSLVMRVLQIPTTWPLAQITLDRLVAEDKLKCENGRYLRND